MNDLDFTFEETPWELTLSALRSGEALSAARFLTLMEGEEEEAVEDALLDLEERHIALDPSDLPRTMGLGETARRLRQEAELARTDGFLAGLEEGDPLRLYLEEVAAIPPCEDVQQLAQKKSRGGEAEREELLRAWLHRVPELAKEMTGRGVLLLDLIQEGSLGLWQTVMAYDGGDFAAAADWQIRQAMAKAVTLQARASGVGQKLKQALEDYRAVDERLLGELGRNPTLEEIAQELHMSPEETAVLSKMLENVRQISRVKAARQPRKEDPAEAEQAVENTAYFQMRQRIQELLSMLPADDAELLTLRFGLEGGLPLSPEDTGRKLGLTKQEVVAKEAAALAKLRNG